MSAARIRLLAPLIVASLLALRLAGEGLTVATYNVANYNIIDRMTPGGYRPDYPKPEAEKAALRQVIRALGADVLALQEVGGTAFLRELQRDLRSEGLDYPHATVLEVGAEPRHLAVLSRRAFTAEVHHADLSLRYFGEVAAVRRGLLEVRVPTAAGEIAVFVLHLKSRYTDRRDDPESARFRAAEAAAARDRILERFPEAETSRFLVVGDLNDGPRSRAVRALERRGRRLIARAVPAADSRGESWTHHYRRGDAYTRVDYIMVSPALQGAVQGGAGRVYDGPGVREASDHRPVTVALDWSAEE